MDLPHVEQATLTRFSYFFFDVDESPISGDSRLIAMLCLPEEVTTLVNNGLGGMLDWSGVWWVTLFLFAGSVIGSA